MSKRDEIQPQEEPKMASGGDDRRGTVNPNDKPVPRSPEPDHDAVRAGKEKLERLKPH